MDEIALTSNRMMPIPIGMDISKSVILSCADCGQKLAEVIVTETNKMREDRYIQPLFTKFKVDKCYKCGGSSFPTDVLEGSVFVGSLTDSYETDVIDTDVEHEFTDNSASKTKAIISTVLTIRKKKNA